MIFLLGMGSHLVCVAEQSQYWSYKILDTEEVKAYNVTLSGIHFTLVDTPGFDDSRGSDQNIMKKILSWLDRSYRQGTRLNGLLYLHRITNPRMSGTALSNLRMFRSLCGPNNFRNVVLATTFWSEIDSTLGNAREQALRTKDDYWAQMLAKDAKMIRLEDSKASNIKVLLDIAANNGKVVVEAQKEMLAGKSMAETAAARQVCEDIERLKAEKAIELAAERRRLQAQIDRRAREARQEIKRERERAEREREERNRIALAMETARRHQREREAEERRAAERKREETERAEQERRLEELAFQRVAQIFKEYQERLEMEALIRRFQEEAEEAASRNRDSGCLVM
jgi:hypothetical protein